MKKILAVIPARAGSKGIPNKNIRLVNNKPLIYYSIKNALESNLITEIVVSTDSPEIQIIAKQMGVKCKHRDKALCGDSVTLDEVIYDVSKDYDSDYIVTMQPTSPTLKRETLDSAIRYCIENELDSVISVINRPHLCWKEEKGKKVPDYEKRLNRQYLPAKYYETGAFVISRTEIVKEHDRLGKNIDVYEVSEEEAIDVDTFEDLELVTNALKQKKIAIYVNGNNKRGMGHIYRALELADEFYTKPDIYYDINQTERKAFGETTHNLIAVNGLNELFLHLKEKKYNLMINDILTTSIDYMIAIRNCLPDAKIVNFEDDGEGAYKADLVINALYHDSDIAHMKTGEKYYIAAKLFMFYQPIGIKKTVEKIFIGFGGADPQNYTDRLLDIITKDNKYADKKFVVVLGRAKKNIDKLLEYNQFPNIEVLHDINNMPEIMSSCDIGITSRGRTGYELAILGVPTIAMAQNKREEKHGFVCDENGFLYLGLNPSDYVIESALDMYIGLSKDEREKYQKILLSHDLKNGRQRVKGLIESL